MNIRSLARRRKLWRRFIFEDNGHKELHSVWQDTRHDPEFKGCKFFLESDGFVYTNIPERLLKPMARLADIRLPDCNYLAEDELEIQELLD